MPLMLRPQGEQVSLPDRLSELGRARRRAVVVGGVFRTLAAFAFVVMLAIGLDLWLNVPVEEDFALDSPFRLIRAGVGDYRVVDTRGGTYPVRLPREPEWYQKTTRAGTAMSRVGVLQGTYLGIYVSNSCGFWHHKPEAGCRSISLLFQAWKRQRHFGFNPRLLRKPGGSNNVIHFPGEE